MIESSVLFLPVNDIQKTTQFYTEICGLTYEVQVKDQIHIFDTGYGYIGFCQYNDGRKPLSGDHGVCISFNCIDEKDVDKHYEMVKGKAKVLTLPGYHPKFPVYSFFVEDPDGYKVEFQKIQK